MQHPSTDHPDPLAAVTIQLLRSAKQGDAQATNELYARVADRLRMIVRLRLGPRLRTKLESCDVVQEALLAAVPHLSEARFETGAELLHWLATLAENRIRDLADHFSAQKRDAARERPLGVAVPWGDSSALPSAEPYTTGTPSRQLMNQEQQARVAAAIDALADDQREALILVRYAGLSYSDAGGHMERSPDAVRMLVARAIVQLGKLLAADQSLKEAADGERESGSG